jgi:DNA polymerase
MPEFPDPDDRTPLAETCERCPALVEGRECISWGNGPLDAALVVVGEAPGYGTPDADRWQGGNWTGMAYTSRHSGRRIRELLADAGYGHDDCYFTNAVKCFPVDSEDPTTNREPTREERANCRPYLREEIETVAPRAVVTTGKHATKSVLSMGGRDLDGFLDAVLDPVPCPTLSTTVLPLLHPSYQEVWLARLGYTRTEYVDAIGSTVDELF